MKLFWIALFGLVGVLSRYYLGLWVSRANPLASFPYGTFLINLSGSFIIGIIYALGVERMLLPEDLRVGLMVGLMGGYTTFSSFSLEVVRLAETGKYACAGLYMVGSPVLGAVLALCGIFLVRMAF